MTDTQPTQPPEDEDIDPGPVPKEWLHSAGLRSTDVQRVFAVSAATVRRWSVEGIIGFYRSANDARIYPECEIERIMRNEPPSEYVRLNAKRDTRIYQERWRNGWRNNGLGQGPWGERHTKNWEPRGE